MVGAPRNQLNQEDGVLQLLDLDGEVFRVVQSFHQDVAHARARREATTASLFREIQTRALFGNGQAKRGFARERRGAFITRISLDELELAAIRIDRLALCVSTVRHDVDVRKSVLARIFARTFALFREYRLSHEPAQRRHDERRAERAQRQRAENRVLHEADIEN